MKKVRFGVIGAGVMGEGHIKTLKQIENCEVTAVCDISQERLKKLGEEQVVSSETTLFSEYEKLIDSGLCDAIAITTPHTSHLKIAEYAFKNKLHVMCDKPIAVTLSEADMILEAWRKAETKFSTMYSMRTTSINKVIKEWMDKGKLGKIRRADMVCTKWLRTQKYFDCQSWRGTWNGEGGGLLMNQAPHNLDLLYWWFGEAQSVQAEVSSRFHEIETEDEVNAVIFTKTGFPIRFYANTAEAPGIDRVEIVGDKGTLTRENDKLIFFKLAEDLDEVVRKSEEPFATIESESVEIEIPDIPRGHKVVFESFIDSIISGAPNEEMVAPGNEGIHAVEWANAMLFSSIKQQKANLPLNRVEYDELLTELRTKKISLTK